MMRVAVVVDQRHRLARRVVGQAEDDEIGVVERLARAAAASLRARRRARSARFRRAPASRSRISSPVVPTAPSMKTLMRHATARQRGRVDIADEPRGRGDAPGDDRRPARALRTCRRVRASASTSESAVARQRAALPARSDATRQRRGIMRREHAVGEADVGKIAADGIGARVERDRTAGQREAPTRRRLRAAGWRLRRRMNCPNSSRKSAPSVVRATKMLRLSVSSRWRRR